jgi:hypothetical protein
VPLHEHSLNPSPSTHMLAHTHCHCAPWKNYPTINHIYTLTKKRLTVTGLVCLMRQQRPMAWSSSAGFKAGSICEGDEGKVYFCRIPGVGVWRGAGFLGAWLRINTCATYQEYVRCRCEVDAHAAAANAEQEDGGGGLILKGLNGLPRGGERGGRGGRRS